jgi:uncharacterized oxidoreductase
MPGWVCPTLPLVQEDSVVVEGVALQRFSVELAQAMGADAEVATEVGRHLVRANLSGHDSHGVMRFIQYVEEADRSLLRPAARPQLLRSGPATALFDAQRGFGHHSTMVATRWAIERARRVGLGVAAIRHSMHVGRLGEYTEQITDEGLVGLVTVGVAGPGSGLVAPFGGVQRFLGTNPWSIGIPASGRPAFIYDAATSSAAEGKIRLARSRGGLLPLGLVRDADGRPSPDPAALYEGGTLTLLGDELAGHKGYGLSMAAALIGGLAMIGDLEPTPAGCMRAPAEWGTRLAGVVVLVIDPATFGDAEEYRRRVAEVLDSVTASSPAPGREVLVPGDPERRSRRRRAAEGVPIPRAIWSELVRIGERLGVRMPVSG